MSSRFGFPRANSYQLWRGVALGANSRTMQAVRHIRMCLLARRSAHLRNECIGDIDAVDSIWGRDRVPREQTRDVVRDKCHSGGPCIKRRPSVIAHRPLRRRNQGCPVATINHTPLGFNCSRVGPRSAPAGLAKSSAICTKPTTASGQGDSPTVPCGSVRDPEQNRNARDGRRTTSARHRSVRR